MPCCNNCFSDKQNKIAYIFFNYLIKMSNRQEFQAVVLAAGRGSRMTQLTCRTPKPLLPVGNKPMIWYPINMLEKAGFDEVIVVVQMSFVDDVKKALEEICPVDIRLDFVTLPEDTETEDFGTAETLRFIKNRITKDFLVVSCDLICDFPLHLLADVFRTYDADITMLVSPARDLSEVPVPRGKVNRKIEKDFIGFDKSGKRIVFLGSELSLEGNITLKFTDMQRNPFIRIHSDLVDGHLYLMKRWILDVIEEEKSLSTVRGDVVPFLVKRKQNNVSNDKKIVNDGENESDDELFDDELVDSLIQQKSTLQWNLVGGENSSAEKNGDCKCFAYVLKDTLCLRANTLVTYCEANRQVSRQLASTHETSGRSSSVTSRLPRNSQVGMDSCVGKGITFGEKVGIKGSVVGNHCIIKDGVKITNCVIMDHVTIESGATLSGCVICANVAIGEKSELKDCLVGHGQSVNTGKYTNEEIINLDQMMEFE